MEPKSKPFDQEISRILDFLAGQSPASKEYKKAVDNLKVLVETKQKHNTFPVPLEVIKVGAYLIATVLVVKEEKFNVISSKAFSWIKFS